MPWHQVVIKHSDDAMIEQLSIQRLRVWFDRIHGFFLNFGDVPLWNIS